MKLICLLVSICLIGLVNTDEIRIRTIFVSEYSNCVLKLKNHKKWEMYSNGQIKPIYAIVDKDYVFETGFVSSNCSNVVFIDDFPAGRKPLENQKLITFFTDNGQFSKDYTTQELGIDTTNITQSIWHFNWLYKYGYEDEERKFVILTRDWYEYHFASMTGKLLQKQRPYGFDENTVIAKGKFYRKANTTRTRFHISKVFAGKKPLESFIDFDASRFGEGTFECILMLKNGEDITPDKYRNLSFF